MTLVPVILSLAVAIVVGVLWARARRRRLAREAAWRAAFESFAGALSSGPVEPDGRRLPARAVYGAARRAEHAGDEPGDRWAVQLAWRRDPLPVLEGPLSLKVHGPRLLPRLCHPELLHALPAEPRPVWRPAPLEPLGTLYLLCGDGETGRLVTEEAAREAAVDARDLHGIALAVLRQRFEEGAVADALRGEIVELRPVDACGASRVLVAGDFLASGERLLAAAPSPAVLWLGPARRREALLEVLGRRRGREEPLSSRLLEIDPSGPRWARSPEG